jgi:carboxymethylenebutenolidase
VVFLRLFASIQSKGPSVKRILTLLLLFFPAFAFALNPEPQKVSFPSGDETVSALLYLPTGSAPHPAVVVIHEWWGLNDWVKAQAADYASLGYVVLAVDLYRGQVASDPDAAHQLMRGLPQDRGVRDLVSAVHYLEQRKDVDAKRVGAVGWCMGGGYAIQLAIAEPSLRSTVVNYGALPTEGASLAKIHSAVLGNFGGKDMGIPPASVDAFAATMKKLGNPPDVKIYPDAGHAFENPNNKAGFRSEDAADAHQRTVTFLSRTLQK